MDIVENWKGQKWEGRKTISLTEIEKLNISKSILSKYATNKLKSGKTSDKQYRITDWVGLCKALSATIPNDEYSTPKLVVFQYEVLGYVDITDQNLEWKYICITNLNTTYSPKFSAYCICNGKSQEMKVHKTIPRNDKRCKTSFQQLPFKDGDVLYIKDWKREPKKQKTVNGWEAVPGAFEWWIKDYKIVERGDDGEEE